MTSLLRGTGNANVLPVIIDLHLISDVNCLFLCNCVYCSYFIRTKNQKQDLCWMKGTSNKTWWKRKCIFNSRARVLESQKYTTARIYNFIRKTSSETRHMSKGQKLCILLTCIYHDCCIDCYQNEIKLKKKTSWANFYYKFNLEWCTWKQACCTHCTNSVFVIIRSDIVTTKIPPPNPIF